MAIRMQPKDIEVPVDDPFKHDRLERKESAEILTHVLTSIAGPCTLAIDASWGNGKSTFLRMWAQHLRNDFPVIEVNAWETDHADDPFAMLSTELTSQLDEQLEGEEERKVLADLWHDAKKMGAKMAPGILQLTYGSLTGQELPNSLKQMIETYGTDRFDAYRKNRDSLKKFKEKLQHMASTISAKHDDKPLIIMIDELDRCRPTYAIKLLEVAKHLFAVEGIIFVLAVNRFELAHAVKAIYGQSFGGQGYLKRFINIDYQLPKPCRNAFIEDLLSQINVNQYFESDGSDIMEQMLCGILGKSDVSHREIYQSIKRIGLVLASLTIKDDASSLRTVVALILRTVDEELYHRFCSGKADDLAALEAVFPGREKGRDLNKAHRIKFEIIIIHEYENISGLSSALVEYYRSIDYTSPEHMRHKTEVLEYYRDQNGNAVTGFEYIIPRIELFSQDLLEDKETANELK